MSMDPSATCVAVQSTLAVESWTSSASRTTARSPVQIPLGGTVNYEVSEAKHANAYADDRYADVRASLRKSIHQARDD
jgi:hypothetical protein